MRIRLTLLISFSGKSSVVARFGSRGKSAFSDYRRCSGKTCGEAGHQYRRLWREAKTEITDDPPSHLEWVEPHCRDSLASATGDVTLRENSRYKSGLSACDRTGIDFLRSYELTDGLALSNRPDPMLRLSALLSPVIAGFRFVTRSTSV